MNWKIALLVLALMVPAIAANGQKKQKKITVSGFVRDAEGQPVANAMFFVDEVKITNISKEDGSYSFKVKPGTRKIMVYSLTNGGLEVDYQGESTIIFELSDQTVDIPVGKTEEAGEVVNMGYNQTTKKNDLTSSVGSVDKEKIATKQYSSIYQMIAGEVPGVSVNGSTIRIRGISSIKGSNDPLFIVDGSPSSSIDLINPMDVESIDILKGSSAAIYGTKGANGVIIIKTKGSRK